MCLLRLCIETLLYSSSFILSPSINNTSPLSLPFFHNLLRKKKPNKKFKMKSSLSSCSTSTFGLRWLSVLALVVVFLSLLLTSAATPVISSPTNIVPRNPSTNQEDKLLHYKVQEANHHPLHPQPCDHQSSVSESSSAQLRSLCLQLHQHKIFHAYQPIPPPPVALDHHDEIDPRYGVEKRLVPSGPNPLHN